MDVPARLAKHLAALARRDSYRKECGTLLLHSATLVRDVVAARGPSAITHLCVGPRFPFNRSPATLQQLLGPGDYSATLVYDTSAALFEQIAGVVTGDKEDVVAEVSCPRPASSLSALMHAPSPSTGKGAVAPARGLLVMDNVSDPGNCGVLFRSAVVFGWAVARVGGCDPYNPKAVRAGRAVQLYTPFADTDWGDVAAVADAGVLGNSPVAVFRAELCGEGVGSVASALRPSTLPIVIVGNEAHGVEVPPALASASRALTIDMCPGPGSLNVAVAAGVIMHTLNTARPPA